ncbi:hypothetical protein HYX08_01200 [Candidatus Woesearchaeota archaeon]|nr:hypothetical protein [Candidatus Woesearchaeota archaeon]
MSISGEQLSKIMSIKDYNTRAELITLAFGQPIIRCRKCNTVMECCEEDYESMSEGQLADYDAGLWRTYLCPNCKVADIIEGQFPCCDELDEGEFEDYLGSNHQFILNILSSENISLKPREKLAKDNIIRGDYNEYLAKKYFSGKGYQIVKLVNQVPTANGSGIHIFNDEEIKNICFLNKIRKVYNVLKKMPISGLPDFLLVKEKEYSFLECKCDPSKLKETQNETFGNLIKKKQKIKIFSTPITKLEIQFGESSIYDLVDH